MKRTRYLSVLLAGTILMLLASATLAGAQVSSANTYFCAPQRVVVQRVGTTSARVSWDLVPGAVSYEVQYRNPSTTDEWRVDQDFKNKRNHYFTSNNLGNYTYYFCVRAVNAQGYKSEWSDVISYTHRQARPNTNGTVVIRYNANGGAGIPGGHTVNKNNGGEAYFTLTTVTPTRPGFEFIGWRCEDSSAYDIDYPGQYIAFGFGERYHGEMLTYHAQWKAKPREYGTVTIRYYGNGGTNAPAAHSTTKDAWGVARFYLSSVRPTRSGYEFIGWRLENDGAYKIDQPGEHISIEVGQTYRDTTLTYYAQWKAKPQEYGTVTIQYYGNGGTNAPASHTTTKDAGGAARFYLSTVRPTRSGYEFIGWRLENNNAYRTYQPGDHVSIAVGQAYRDTTLTYYAQWKAKPQEYGTVTIQYYGNGGSGVPYSQTVRKDAHGTARFTIPSNEPWRRGYRFIGWRLENESRHGIDQPCDRIAVNTCDAYSDNSFVYYALWRRR